MVDAVLPPFGVSVAGGADKRGGLGHLTVHAAQPLVQASTQQLLVVRVIIMIILRDFTSILLKFVSC